MNKKILFFATLALFVGVVGSVWLRAAPNIGTTEVAPNVVGVNRPTPVTVTAQIHDTSLIAASVQLLKVDATGRALATLGAMYDDGSHGDTTPGDKIFSRQLELTETATGLIHLQVSAAFRGVLRRATSPIQVLNVWQTLDRDMQGISLSANYPPEWHTRNAGRSIEITDAETIVPLSDTALSSSSLFRVKVLPEANPGAKPIDEWFDVSFSDGFASEPANRQTVTINGHSGVAVDADEIGRNRHVFLGYGTSIVHLSYSLENANATEHYTAILRSLHIGS
jgi:hypothetical protein